MAKAQQADLFAGDPPSVHREGAGRINVQGTNGTELTLTVVPAAAGGRSKEFLIVDVAGHNVLEPTSRARVVVSSQQWASVRHWLLHGDPHG